MNNQVSIQKSNTQLSINIYMNGSRFKSSILFIRLFMIFWFFISVAIASTQLQPHHFNEQIPLILWLLVSTLIIGLNFYFIAWLKNTHEELIFNSDYLVFKKYLPFNQISEYKINLIDFKKLHYQAWENPWRGVNLPSPNKGNIHFRAKYNLKHSFGINLSEDEANSIILNINQWFESHHLHLERV